MFLIKVVKVFNRKDYNNASRKMNEHEFLKSLSETRKLEPEEYRVAVSDLFRDFIRQKLETKTGAAFKTQVVSVRGLSFVHRPDLWLGLPNFPDIYLETKVIATAQRVAPDHDKRMYQIALASVDLKLQIGQGKPWKNIKNKHPCVAFALAIPSTTPARILQHVEDHVFSLWNCYLNACCLYIYDLEQMRRRDDLLENGLTCLNQK